MKLTSQPKILLLPQKTAPMTIYKLSHCSKNTSTPLLLATLEQQRRGIINKAFYCWELST